MRITNSTYSSLVVTDNSNCVSQTFTLDLIVHTASRWLH